MKKPLSSITLERFILSELPEEELRAVEQAVAADAALANQVDVLRRSSAAIRERYNRDAVAKNIQARAIQERFLSAKNRPRDGRFAIGLVGSLAVTVIVAVGLWPVIDAGRRAPDPTPTLEETRIKGLVSSLRVFRKTRAGSELLPSGSRASAGDLVRLGYEATRPRYGLIVSVDGRGNLTRHWPASGAFAEPLRPQSLVLLDQAFELDDAPKFERFYLVTAERSFPVGEVLSAFEKANAAGAGERVVLPQDLELSFVELKKEPSK